MRVLRSWPLPSSNGPAEGGDDWELGSHAGSDGHLARVFPATWQDASRLTARQWGVRVGLVIALLQILASLRD